MRTTPAPRAVVAVVLTACLATTALAAEALDRHPEEIRDSMRALAGSFEKLHAGNAAAAQRAARLQRGFEAMSWEQLEVLQQSLAAAPGTLSAVERFNARAAVEIDRSVDGAAGTLADPQFSETCGGERPAAADVADQLAMWEGLAAAAAAAQATCDAADAATVADACDVAAMAHDAALIARFVYENSAFCSADIDSAVIDASLAGLAELEAVVADVGSDVLDALAAHDTEVKEALAAEGQAIRDQIADVLANQETLLANQAALLDGQAAILDEIETLRQLILTPPGRRPGWNRYPHPSENGDGNGPGN